MLWTTFHRQQVSFQQAAKFHLARRSLEPLRNETILLTVISPALYQLRHWGLDKKPSPSDEVYRMNTIEALVVWGNE